MVSGQDALQCRVGNSTSSSQPCAFGARLGRVQTCSGGARKQAIGSAEPNHTPSSNTASIRLPGAAVGVPPAGVALEERGAEGTQGSVEIIGGWAGWRGRGGKMVGWWRWIQSSSRSSSSSISMSRRCWAAAAARIAMVCWTHSSCIHRRSSLRLAAACVVNFFTIHTSSTCICGAVLSALQLGSALRQALCPRTPTLALQTAAHPGKSVVVLAAPVFLGLPHAARPTSSIVHSRRQGLRCRPRATTWMLSVSVCLRLELLHRRAAAACLSRLP